MISDTGLKFLVVCPSNFKIILMLDCNNNPEVHFESCLMLTSNRGRTSEKERELMDETELEESWAAV